ncbi:MAG: hypothetical protein J5777_08605 [Clostridiales bacterium]|nr:hypothetical protein [Clostridiales bacterium]
MYLLCYGRSENAKKTGRKLIDSIGGRWIDGDDFLSGGPVIPEMTGDTAIVMLLPLEAAVRIAQEMIPESMRRLPVIAVSADASFAAVIRKGGVNESAYCFEIYEAIKKELGNKCFTDFGGNADIGGSLADVAARYGMAISNPELLRKVDERLGKGLPVRIFTDLRMAYGDPILDPMLYDLRKYPSDLKDEFIKQYYRSRLEAQKAGAVTDVFITCSKLEGIADSGVLGLTPKILSIGLEQRTRTDPQYAAEGIKESLEKHMIEPLSVCTVAVPYTTRENDTVKRVAEEFGAQVASYENAELSCAKPPLRMTFAPEKINDTATAACFLASEGGDVILRRNTSVTGIVFSAAVKKGAIRLS